MFRPNDGKPLKRSPEIPGQLEVDPTGWTEILI